MSDIQKNESTPEINKQAIQALARRCLWIAYCWNDHNFPSAHIMARNEAQQHGIHSLEEANRWLTELDNTETAIGSDDASIYAFWGRALSKEPITKEWLAKALENGDDNNCQAGQSMPSGLLNQQALQNATEAVLNAWDRNTHGPMNGHLWNDLKSLVSTGIRVYIGQSYRDLIQAAVALQESKAKIEDLQQQLDEADRRAGAAERQMDQIKASEFNRSRWLDQAKKQAGYGTNASFDTVWEETLALAKQAKALGKTA